MIRVRQRSLQHSYPHFKGKNTSNKLNMKMYNKKKIELCSQIFDQKVFAKGQDEMKL